MSNVWHDVNPSRITPDEFLVFIEIPQGSKNKYELDKETGKLILDRILYTSTIYPQNYGLIPLTYADDLDPLDALVITSQPIVPGTLVRCYPIGVLHMIDSGLRDEKIIAVAKDDPFYSKITDVKELPPHIFDEIEHFFTVYKALEGKSTSVYNTESADKAKKVIVKALEAYKEKILPKIKDRR